MVERRGVMHRLLVFLVVLSGWTISPALGACQPQYGCPQALAFYNLSLGDQLSDLVNRFHTSLDALRLYNNIPNPDQILAYSSLLFPFSCDCLGDQLGHYFNYTVQSGDSLYQIATVKFEDLSRPDWIAKANNLADANSILPNAILNIPVNCTCGDPQVGYYGLFTTYVVQEADTLSQIAQKFSVPASVVEKYNPNTNWQNLTAHSSILSVPTSFANGTFPVLTSSGNGTGGSGSHTAAIIGGSVGGIIAFLTVGALVIYFFRRKKFARFAQFPLLHRGEDGDGAGNPARKGPFDTSSDTGPKSMSSFGSGHGVLTGLAVDKSVEFSYEELAAATSNFSIANKIGEGGYGAVYYGELRGQKVAVKRMNLQATKEFLSELKVLTHVHHTNLVQLIGYCTVESLFLIYEFVENGTLAQHLHASGRPPLSWSARVQIALDSARGLEYIHEHTKPTYIHRDVKSSNILVDKYFHAKVADFGLTKLTESGMTQPTRLVGTFGYMSPEYARFGDVSPKLDVYSFGVVLFEIISAKEAIVRAANSSSIDSSSREEHRGLVSLFESVLKDRDGKEKLQKLIDPNLSTYPIESVWKMVQLAGACTHENPELRPTMRTAVVALMTLSSSTQEWELNVADYNGLGGLVSGR